MYYKTMSHFQEDWKDIVQGNTVHLCSEPEDIDSNHLPPPHISIGVYLPPPPASSDAYSPTTMPEGVMGMYRSSMDGFYNPLHIKEINLENIQCTK